MVNWIEGTNLASVNLGITALPSPAEGGDIQTIHLNTGDGAFLPAHDFYLFFPLPANPVTGEGPEYVYIASRTGDTLTCGPDPFGVSASTGRAAIDPVRWPAAHHPAGALLQLRNVFEIYSQLQARLDAHTHDGTTANGPVLTQNQGTNTTQITNNTGAILNTGDVVAYSNGQAVAVPSTGYLGLPIAIVCSPQGGPPTGVGDYSAANGAPVYVRVAGVSWARCASSVTAGSPVQTTNAKTITNLVSPALGAVGFALTNATAITGGYYCQVLVINRGADILTPDGVQNIKNKTIFSPVLYSSADATARMSFPTLTANDTLVGVNTPATLLAKTLTSPTINGGTVSGAAISGGTISGAAVSATNAALTTPTLTTPAASGGTYAGGTFTSPIINTPAVTGGTFSSPALTDPTMLSNINLSAATLYIVPGTTAWGSVDHAGSIVNFLVNNNGRIDFPRQGYCQVFQNIAFNLPSDDTPVTLVAGTETYDRLGEYNNSTGLFVPNSSGVYQFDIAMQLTITNSGGGYLQYIVLNLINSVGYTVELYRYTTDPAITFDFDLSFSASHALYCGSGTNTVFSIHNPGNSAHPVTVLGFQISITRLN